MKPHELFGVVIRAFALWEIIAGLQILPQYWGAINQFNYKNEAELFRSAMLAMISMAGIKIILGVLLFIAAGWLTRLAYPTPAEKAE